MDLYLPLLGTHTFLRRPRWKPCGNLLIPAWLPEWFPRESVGAKQGEIEVHCTGLFVSLSPGDGRPRPSALGPGATVVDQTKRGIERGGGSNNGTA